MVVVVMLFCVGLFLFFDVEFEVIVFMILVLNFLFLIILVICVGVSRFGLCLMIVCLDIREMVKCFIFGMFLKLFLIVEV